MPLYDLSNRAPDVPANGRYWVAPGAHVIGSVVVGEDVGIWFGCVLRGDNEPITIGSGTNVQDLCVFHTDPAFPLRIGKGCTIGHRAILHGCSVGDNSLIGMGAIVLNGARIGDDCIVGAGALVPEGKAIPDRSLVVGLPGRVVRELTGEEVAANRRSAEHYVDNWKRFGTGLAESGG